MICKPLFHIYKILVLKKEGCCSSRVFLGGTVDKTEASRWRSGKKKNLPASAGDARDAGWILGREDPLEEEMATHSRVLAWKIPGTEESNGLQFMGLQRDKTE